VPAIFGGALGLLIILVRWFTVLRPHGGVRAVLATKKWGAVDRHGHSWVDLPEDTRQWAVAAVPCTVVAVAIVVGGVVAVLA
jgi:hypothetical protein